MEEKNYLLTISGMIESPKQKEFEQTIRFVFNMLPSTCLSSHLAIDVFNPDTYYVLTLWRTGSDLATFNRSNEYNLIKGSFQVLGRIDRSIVAQQADIQVFQVRDNIA